ncbi:hypothetical protein VSWAT3_17573 [Vibrionales bacterium SWAT-3]|nr:hypothetical protein VSWAT3_17573 [Vibrionales bacterium SWAT-3]
MVDQFIIILIAKNKREWTVIYNVFIYNSTKPIDYLKFYTMLLSPFLKDINKKKKIFNGGFNMNNKIPYSSYSGNSEHLCKKGDAVEFIQPWYTPISTTPENTGMAIGRAGSNFNH